jgi:hypothetical protein
MIVRNLKNKTLEIEEWIKLATDCTRGGADTYCKLDVRPDFILRKVFLLIFNYKYLNFIKFRTKSNV